MMIPIAKPLATTELATRIHKVTKKLLEEKRLISGIKASQKAVIAVDSESNIDQKKDMLMVFSACTSPMDLITHIPILCEKHNVPYVFVENNTFLNGFTCVLLKNDIEIGQIVEEVSKLN